MPGGDILAVLQIFEGRLVAVKLAVLPINLNIILLIELVEHIDPVIEFPGHINSTQIFLKVRLCTVRAAGRGNVALALLLKGRGVLLGERNAVFPCKALDGRKLGQCAFGAVHNELGIGGCPFFVHEIVPVLGNAVVAGHSGEIIRYLPGLCKEHIEIFFPGNFLFADGNDWLFRLIFGIEQVIVKRLDRDGLGTGLRGRGLHRSGARLSRLDLVILVADISDRSGKNQADHQQNRD